MPGQTAVNTWSFGDKTMTIVDANPSFSGLSYKDTNSSVISVTNNDQFIVRNRSSLQIHFNSATAKKYASISKYQIDFAGSTRDVNSSENHTIGSTETERTLSLYVQSLIFNLRLGRSKTSCSKLKISSLS